MRIGCEIAKLIIFWGCGICTVCANHLCNLCGNGSHFLKHTCWVLGYVQVSPTFHVQLVLPCPFNGLIYWQTSRQGQGQRTNQPSRTKDKGQGQTSRQTRTTRTNQNNKDKPAVNKDSSTLCLEQDETPFDEPAPARETDSVSQHCNECSLEQRALSFDAPATARCQALAAGQTLLR